jgi:hypothetical protein
MPNVDAPHIQRPRNSQALYERNIKTLEEAEAIARRARDNKNERAVYFGLQSRFVLLSPRREYYRPAHFAGSCVIGMRMTRGHFDSTSFRIGLVLIGRFHVADDAP